LTERHELPELVRIRETVLRHMPEGHRLRSVDLSIGTETWDDSSNSCSESRNRLTNHPGAGEPCSQAMETASPSFIVLVDIEKECVTPEPFGWANKLSKIIREKWPKDAFLVKIRIWMPGMGAPASA
jgi:hypothetical protein